MKPLSMFFVLAALFSLSLGQRPSTASICDYYAETLYGTNSSTTQYRLIQGIISLAFGGGSGLFNASSDITGILNPGTFQDLNVDLRPWFNGTLASTNLNNQGVGINWLDGGGSQPLNDFLTGKTQSVVLANTTNEYRLFTHFFGAFSHIFGCTLPQPQPPSGTSGGSLSLAYVHKFMGLNYTDLGHFIDQLTKATTYFGFSDQDSQTFSTNLNSEYNVRCAPPVNGQLLSLCQDPSCPLAEPSPDCDPYVDLQPNGAANGSVTSTQAAAAPSSTTSSASSSSSSYAALPTISTSPTPTSSPTSSSSSSSQLSGGAIAGIAIGSAAVVLVAIGLLIFFLRRPKQPKIPAFVSTPGYSSPSYITPSYQDHHVSYNSSAQSPWSPPIAEMESPRYPMVSPEMGTVHEVPRLQ